MTQPIVRWGNSQGVRLPKPLLELIGLADGDAVDIVAQGGSLILTKSRGEKRGVTIEKLFEGFDGAYEPVDVDWGKPTGDELW